MSNSGRLERSLLPRQQAVLSAIVDCYVQTGEPIASQVIASSSGLSSATIRNVMAELVESGYLEQPHTSAGRVPTAKAFRLHVERLMGTHRLEAAMLPQHSLSQIQSRLQGVSGRELFLERTSQVLAVLSSGVGVAMATLQEDDPLEHVHFQRLATRRVLAVVVTRAGVVRDRVLVFEQDLAPDQLEAAARYLNENFRGWLMDAVRAEIARRAETELTEYQALRLSAEELWRAAMLQEIEPAHMVFVDGVSNLIGNVYDGQWDGQRLREMLAALEAKERVMALLHAYFGAEREFTPVAGGVRVVFDMETHAPEMQGLVLVAAPAASQGTRHGAVGVIATQRMDYANTINAVRYVAQLYAETQGPA